MVNSKYGHLVKTLNFQEAPFGKLVWLMGTDLEGLKLNIVRTYTSFVGEWTPGRTGGHVHPYGECFFLAGLDYDHPNEVVAEIEEVLGDEGEVHVCSAPGVIAIPAGLHHNPMVTLKADKPYGGLVISLNGEHKFTDLPERSAPTITGNKYGHLVKKLELRDTQRKSGGNADYIAGWNGKGLEGLDLNFTWAFHTGIGPWHEKDPHVHPSDEVLLFLGCDPDNPQYLGAEIEIAMGEEQEKHVFDTPTVVVVPKGLVHCPLITRRVNKPFNFSAISLNTEHETTWLG